MSRRECTIFLVGEGPSDIGGLAFSPPWQEKHREGFYQPLLRKMAGAGFSLHFDGQKLSTLGREPMEEDRLREKKAAQALALAVAAGASVLVYSRDLDKTQGRTANDGERRRRHRELTKELEQDFEAAKSQDSSLASMALIISIPARMIENWALADRVALKSAGGNPSMLPTGDCESYWGNEQDPESNHPKRVLQRVLGRSVKVTAEHYASIAAAADIEQLRRACPSSFVPFADAVEAQRAICQTRE